MRDILRSPKPRRWIAPALALTLAAAACSGETEGDAASPTATAASTMVPATCPVPEGAQGPYLCFDARTGGSTVIQTYKGPGESEFDRQSNGTFFNGQTAPVACRQTGRDILPDTSPGVEERALRPDEPTNEWFRLLGDSPVRWATGTYGNIVPEGATVPACTPPTLPVPHTS